MKATDGPFNNTLLNSCITTLDGGRREGRQASRVVESFGQGVKGRREGEREGGKEKERERERKRKKYAVS